MACQRSVLSPFNALPPTQNPQNQAISTNRLRSQEKEPSMLRSPTSLRSNPYLRPKKDRPLLGRRYTSRPTKLYLNYRVALSLPSKILLRPYTKHSTRLHKHRAKAGLKKILGRGHTKAKRANVFFSKSKRLTVPPSHPSAFWCPRALSEDIFAMDYTTLLLSGDSERLVWETSIYDLGRCRDFP